MDSDLLKSQQRISNYSDTTTCLRAGYMCLKKSMVSKKNKPQTTKLSNRKALISSQAIENSTHVPTNCKFLYDCLSSSELNGVRAIRYVSSILNKKKNN